MDKAAAWQMPICSGLSVAVGQMQLVNIIDKPEYIVLPNSPDYCKYIVKWNGMQIPVMMLSLWLDVVDTNEMTGIVAVAVYTNEDGEIQYGGFYLQSAPVLEYVDNNQSLSLEQQPENIKYISLSCYSSVTHGAVPILNVSKIFSSAMLDYPGNCRDIGHV